MGENEAKITNVVEIWLNKIRRPRTFDVMMSFFM